MTSKSPTPVVLSVGDAPTEGPRGAFDFISLSFCSKPESTALLLRSQHSEILLMADTLLGELRDFNGVFAPGVDWRQRSLEFRNSLTTLVVNITIHFSLEDNLLHKFLSSDPRARALAEQHTRDMIPLKSQINAFNRRFATPSTISEHIVEFSKELEDIVINLTEQFKAEERDLYLWCDRLSRH